MLLLFCVCVCGGGVWGVWVGCVGGGVCGCVCSLDNFLLKNVIVFIFGNQVSKWRSFVKRAIFDLLFTVLVTREKVQKFLQHIYHLHESTFLAHPIGLFYFYLSIFFLPHQFCKNEEFIMYGFSLVQLLVLILIRAILEQSINNKMVSKT